MIVSHARKFIFLKTHKTAGTSLEIALSKYCGPEDILTPIASDEGIRREIAGIGAQNYGRPISQYGPGHYYARFIRREIPAAYTEHMRAVDARERLGEKVWNAYFKFTIVRNPFDRILSRYHWTMKTRPHLAARWGVTDLGSFIRYRADYVNENWLTYTSGDRLLVDDTVRYEHREEDLARISERIGLDHNLHEDMSRINAKGSFRPKAERSESLLGPGEIALVRGLCAAEIARFGYEPMGARSAA
ncbi:sulfotransferase family 2 domain-containing protein [Amaricoccus solimangrovi]|uniref:Sulfotransferase family protein n=1 Tax=Amaricoccus solimangrovi TaxID=2589815 RepID=A0A501WY99_9RHOB|nr:sulfotransferase family 2 domain-containing protein [Amaricoccus solimangrovi]TPE53540.1 sulfotransferase family protein [Amaricoccus solimangrovi]